MSIYKKIYTGLMVVLVILALLIALVFLNPDFQEFVLSSISEEETIYAKGYSYKSWKEVKINDNVDRVLQLLGDPLKIYKRTDGSSSYYYT
jgi:ferric iron reductase protein FhuF